jgi:hypothetical protein
MIEKNGIWKASCMLIVLALSACVGSDVVEEAQPKDLFSLWSEVETGSLLELSGGELNQARDVYYFFNDGAQCDCDFTAIGDQTSGYYIMNACSYKPESASVVLDCNPLNETGLYEKKDDILSVNGENASVKYN